MGDDDPPAEAFRLPARCHLPDLGVEGFFMSAGLLCNLQPAFFIHVEKGLDLKRGAHDGGSGGDTSSVPEMIKGVHRKPVADLQPVFSDPGGQSGKAAAFCLPLQGFADKKALSDGGSQCVDAGDAPLRVKCPQLVYSKLCRLESSRQPEEKQRYRISLPS